MSTDAEYTILETVTVNFPDISFEKRLFGGLKATVPNVYVSTYKPWRKIFNRSVVRANLCLGQHNQRFRGVWGVKPLVVKGQDEAACAAKVIETIATKDVSRHTLNPDSDVVPVPGVSYFPVYQNDFFHDHGDPSFIDMSPISFRDSDYVDPEEEIREIEREMKGMLLSAFEESGGNIGDVLSRDPAVAFAMLMSGALHDEDSSPYGTIPTSYPEEGAIVFDLNYGDSHCHFIDAPTLAAKLEP